jgi:Nucleotidyl transferase AbiEii toxin, Type IV TA system
MVGIPVDVVRYPYAPLETPRRGPEGVRVAGLRDLAAMKLATIAGRGLRRDFWDVYAIIRAGMPLATAVRAYEKRFGLAEPEL